MDAAHDLARARRWRDRAEELRAVATATGERGVSESLRIMADNWERMADWLERAVLSASRTRQSPSQRR